MLRRASMLLSCQPILAAKARPFSTDLPVAPSADATDPHMDLLKTPLSFMQPRPPTPSSITSKFTVNFVLPYTSELATKEDRGNEYFHVILWYKAKCQTFIFVMLFIRKNAIPITFILSSLFVMVIILMGL
ncbi:hypothetical protein CXB51_024864 [Gossypium anomalum]|uniref:Uncharacterized protein n=1 Tax=Gossypium anomalum TaxID=47600 RepID=A0A8J5YD74_9ROSI|nr:hypothetical protein CXB51_024864 [Gossypium anomalum]